MRPLCLFLTGDCNGTTDTSCDDLTDGIYACYFPWSAGLPLKHKLRLSQRLRSWMQRRMTRCLPQRVRKRRRGVRPPTPRPQVATWSSGETLTRNWDGLRAAMVQHGIEPFVFWTGIASGNPLGGRSQGHITAVDDFYLGVKLDLNKLVRWHGASLLISGVDRGGQGLTNNYIGSQYNVQQTVGGQSLFFYQLALKKSFHDGRMSFKIGRFGASDDINVSPLYSYYLNNGINGDIRNVLFDTQSSAYPFSTWAALYRADLSHGVTVQAARCIRHGRTSSSLRTNGVDWTFHKGDGNDRDGAGGSGDLHQERRELDEDAAGRVPGRSKDHYWLGDDLLSVERVHAVQFEPIGFELVWILRSRGSEGL